MTSRLILLGGGHAHIEVLRRLARDPEPGLAVTLVSPEPFALYSGLAPAWLAGAVPESALAVDLSALAARAGAAFVAGAAAHVDVPGRTVVLATGEHLAFEMVSLDIGAAPAGRDIPGVVAHAVAPRPLARLRDLAARADALVAAGDDVGIAVVGAGAAGIEVALALDARARARGARPTVTLVEPGPGPLPGAPARARAIVRDVLARRGVVVVAGRSVAGVDAAGLVLDDGRRVPAGLVAWLAGAEAPPLVAGSGLARDAAGYLAVDASLRAADGAPVWGAGDCVAIADGPALPRAGVHAVRQGPVLTAALRAAHRGSAAPAYRPKVRALVLLDTADGQAVLIWRSIAFRARWVLALKRHIDLGFVARYR